MVLVIVLPVGKSPCQNGKSSLASMLDNLTRLPDFRSSRVSSFDPRGGNRDARRIKPGETLTLAEIKGPGEIRHMWVTISSYDKYHLRRLILRMYWDGAKFPSVETPIGDFFAQGNAEYHYVNSLPVSVGHRRGLNCFWPMPFKKKAKITVTNASKKTTGSFYYYIDYRKYEKENQVPPLYFHAHYRQETPCRYGRDYNILKARGKGYYVGCVLSIHQNERGWWGEGDDKIYIDGAEKPTLWGTGSEDYFCHAWGMGKEQTGLYFGSPMGGGKYEEGSMHTCYRWHIMDPIAFHESIVVDIEHKGGRYPGGKLKSPYDDRVDDYYSVAFYYLDHPQGPWEKLPVPRKMLPGDARYETAGADLLPPVRTSGDKVEPQMVKHGLHAWFRADAPGDFFELEIPVEKDSEYRIFITLTLASDYGIMNLKMDGKILLRNYDCFNDRGGDGRTHVISKREEVGRLFLKKGKHLLRVEIAGKNPKSGGYYAGIAGITLKPLK